MSDCVKAVNKTINDKGHEAGGIANFAQKEAIYAMLVDALVNPALGIPEKQQEEFLALLEQQLGAASINADEAPPSPTPDPVPTQPVEEEGELGDIYLPAE